MGRRGKATVAVPRYWYHSLRGRALSADGGIPAYSLASMRGGEEIAGLFPDADPATDRHVYLAPAPLSADAMRIDLARLDLGEVRLTGQAEGFAVYRGDVPAEAITTL